MPRKKPWTKERIALAIDRWAAANAVYDPERCREEAERRLEQSRLLARNTLAKARKKR